MRNLLVLGFIIFQFSILFAQEGEAASQATEKGLPEIEETLKKLGWDFNKNPDDEIRLSAADQFLPQFKSALQLEGAYDYRFDSLQMVSFVYPQDSSFRMITWQLFVNKEEYKYFGFIQKKEKPSQLIELTDRSNNVFGASRKELGADNWYGALYYNMKEIDTKEGKRYVLFGFDAKGLYMRSKLLDVLTFKGENEVVFGMPIFEQKRVVMPRNKNEKMQVSTLLKSRFILEYAATSAISLNYIPERDIIIFDHLIEMGGQYKGQGPTAVPDGSYESFKWNGEVFEHELKVFREIQDTPVMEDRPILDDNKRKKKNVFGGK